jgi:hypothetical protein
MTKVIGFNLTEEIEDLYTENYKTLVQKTEDISKYNGSRVHGLEDLVLLILT